MQRTVEESFDSIFQPLVKELKEKGASFPKTVVYTKLNWCGYDREAAVRDCKDIETMRSVAQYHSPCTKEVSLFNIRSKLT